MAGENFKKEANEAFKFLGLCLCMPLVLYILFVLEAVLVFDDAVTGQRQNGIDYDDEDWG